MSSEASSDFYPAGPDSVPDDLTQPGAGYMRHAWLAMIGLVVWIALYIALTGWFVWTTYRYVAEASAGGNDAFIGYLMAIPTAFFAIFMLKALFFMKRGGEPDDLEITAEQEPKLFDFLHRLADEAGAPRPHRVFLSHRVNAAVFYDLSIANLLFPSKKNLEIGLGLVNALTLAELKAVLAHEFGHFAQRSMAVDRWVYTAQQIAGHIIHQRDVLDGFLRGLSEFDLRIAWLGWILRLIVWSLRSLLETAFHLVILAQRALSREMEFHADLVAVSLTGSDALIHALHRLQTADSDLDRALGIASREIADGRAVEDVFSIQSKISERIATILDDTEYGEPPVMPKLHREAHRVFDKEDAQAPRMWSTHPPNRDREDNAKQRYIEVPQDDRRAWVVFGDAAAQRRSVTARLMAIGSDDKELEPSTTEQTLGRIDEQYGRIYYESKYRGSYLGRSIVLDVKTADDLFGPTLSEDEAREGLDRIYPCRLVDELERVRQLDSEIWTLEALRDRRLKPQDGVIRHRGEELQRSELAAALEMIREERAEANRKVIEHDRKVRTVHRDLAGALAPQAGARLTGLVELLHYSDHSESNLQDARGELANVWSIITADGNISGRERKRLIATCVALHQVLEAIHDVADQVVVDAEVAERLEMTSWSEALGAFELPVPDKDNLSGWLDVLDSWLDSALDWLGALRTTTLEVLLEAESEIERCGRFGGVPAWSGTVGRIPATYATLVPGEERVLQTKLGLWDRFQIADGFFPAVARLAVAVLVIGGAVMMGGMVGQSTITVYNGLSRSVAVEIGGQKFDVSPFAYEWVMVDPDEALPIVTRTFEGEVVESFEAPASAGFVDYIYNVAGASPLIRWTAVYGDSTAGPPRFLGAPRWTTTDASVIFEDPPESIDTKSDGGTRSVLSGGGDGRPGDILGTIENEQEAARMIASHVRWDAPNSPMLFEWMQAASGLPDADQVLAARLEANPSDVLTRRVRMDMVDSAAREAICEEEIARAKAEPKSGNRRYLAARCLGDESARDAQYLAGNVRWPKNGWFSMAAGFTLIEQGQWREAEAALVGGLERLPMMTDAIAPELARVRRYLEDDSLGGGTIPALARRSPSLAFELSLETGEDLEGGPLAAYTMLGQGRLKEAIKKASQGGDDPNRVVILAAASDGAWPKLRERARRVPMAETLDPNTFWSNAGLALRSGSDVGTLVETYEELGFDVIDGVDQGVWRFLHAAIDGQDRATAELHLDGLTARERGLAYTAAAVALGDKAPKSWRRAAMRLLFASERPYFDLAAR